MPDEEWALPQVQPDRAWAEHLGLPRIIADLHSLRQSHAKVVQRLRDTTQERDRLRHRVENQRSELERLTAEGFRPSMTDARA